MQPAAVLSILVNANTSQATAALTKTQTQLKATEAQATRTSGAVGGKLASAAKIGGAALGVGLVYGMAKSIKVGAEFEKQMDSLSAVTGANTKEMKKLENQALRFGQKTAYSASEAAAAQIELAKGGLALKDIMGGALPAALSLAAAGEMELADAAETTVNAMKLFGLRGKDATKVADMLATAANTTTADVDDFAMALKQGGSIAKQAGYNMNDTVTVLEALAEAGIKNSDAGTSMKAAFLQLLAPTEKQQALMEKLNFDVVDNNGNLKNAAGISKELQGALGGMTNAQQAANLKILAGSDGFRTLSALYDAGPEKLRKFSDANREQGTAAEIAREKMDNLKGDVENLSGAMETIGIVIYEKVKPALRDVTQFATDAATAFGDLIQGKSDVPDWAKDFGDSFSALGRGLKGVWEDVILPIIRTLGPGFKDSLEAAARAVKGGVDIIAGILTLDLGRAWQGVKDLFGGVGGYFLGVFKGAAAIVAAPVKALAKALTAPIKAGVNALKSAVTFVFDKILGAVSTTLGAVADAAGAFDWLPGVGGKLGDLADAAHGAQDSIDGFRESLRGDEPEDKAARNLGKVSDAVDFLTDRVGVNKKTLKDWGNFVDGRMDKTAKSGDDMSDDLGRSLLKAGTSFVKLGDKSAQQANRVQGNNSSMVNAVGKGLNILVDNTNKALKGFGAKAVSFTAKSAGNAVAEGAAGLKLQRGGPINMGAPSGDTVPAMLERGEYVLNRKAVAAVGKQQLDAINFGHAARFQVGGSVAAMTRDMDSIDAKHMTYVWGGSHGSSPAPHGGPFDCSSAVSHILQHGGGYDIPTMVSGQLASWGKPGKGPVTIYANPEHVLMSVNDRFWGTSSSNPGGGPGWIPTPSASYLSGFAARVPNGDLQLSTAIKRVLLDGPKGALTTMGQGALDMTRKAANSFLRKKSSLSGGNSNLNMLTGPGKTLGASVYGFGEAGTGTVGASGRSLIGVPAYAELAMGTALGGLPFGKKLKITAPGGRTHIGVKEDIGLGGGSVGGLPRSIDLWRDLAEPLGLDGSFLGQVKVQGLQHGGLVQKLAKGGQAGKPGLNINPPSGMGLQVTGPASFPGWSQANSAASLAAALTAKLNEIAGLDETLDLERSLADRDGLFTASEIQSQIALNAKLLPALNAARDIAKLGATTVLGGLGVAKGPNRAALLDMAPGFSDTVVDMQGVTGKGGRIFDTFMEIARLQSTTPDVPGGRGTILDAIESQIALAGLTPDLADDIVGYKALVSYWEQALSGLQASGAPFGEIGSAASALRSARDTLNDLLGGSGSTSGIESDLNALKLEQAMATIRRLNVGIAQNAVFSGMPVMHNGGVVPGPPGADVPIIAQAGETVTPAGHKPEVRVTLEDKRTIVSVDGQIEAIVDNKLNQIARSRSYAGAGRL